MSDTILRAVGGWYRIEGVPHQIAEATRIRLDLAQRIRIVTTCRKVALVYPKEKIAFLPMPGTPLCARCLATKERPS